MSQITKMRFLPLFGILVLVMACSKIRGVRNEKILVTYDGIPEISIGDTVRHIINGSTNYIVESKKVKSYGREFMKLIIKRGNEEIGYFNYDEKKLSWLRVTSIICTHPKCVTPEGLSVGMSVVDFRNIYQIKDTELRGGINKSIGYFVPEVLQKQGAYVVMSKVVIKLNEAENDTIVDALIIESN